MQQKPTRISGDGSQYVGKRLLVGITVNSAAGEFLYQEQFHGLILNMIIQIERGLERRGIARPM